MDEARALASKGAPSFTVVVADVQEKGRGRTSGRTWEAKPGESLLCTVLIRYPAFSAIPPALSLRAGLAAAQAIEKIGPSLTGKVFVKWPNDVLIGKLPTNDGEPPVARKMCGVLCESDGKTVFIGTGINLSQTDFPPGLRAKATSFSMETGHEPDRFGLLETYIQLLRTVLSDQSGAWRVELERRLYLRNRRVRFENGAAGSGRILKGTLSGIAEDGGLLIIEDGKDEPSAYANGELLVYDRPDEF